MAALQVPHYRVAFDDRAQHLLRVSLTLPAPAAQQRLSLPVWLPGSYLLREFARHLQDLRGTQAGRPVHIEQVDKTSWIAHCNGTAALELSWRVHALDGSVRGAWLDGERAFFNGSSLFLAADGRTDGPQHLSLGRLPAGWDVATAMRRVAPGGPPRFEADDYAELIDHPFELGRFWCGQFDVAGVPHEFVVTGAWPGFDGARLLADTTRICRAQVRLWHGRGKPPFKRYVFLLRAGDDGYGGLEHRASTALQAVRTDLPRVGQFAGTAADDAGYQRLLGLISHEYFHAWNVKRLTPVELAAPDLGREAYTQLLWWFEGVTSYYDDLTLVRAGLVTPEAYLRLLASHLQTVAGTPGRQVQSVAQASFDAWTRYYRPDAHTPNGTVSYYAKGALVAACLDLTLRRDGAGTLDDVLRRLWQLRRPITEADIADAVAAVGGRSYRAELDDWVHGVGELPLPDLLRSMGVSARTEAPGLAGRWGLRVQEAALTGVRVRHVLRGGAAEAAGVQPGDELLAVDGWRLRRLDDAAAWLTPGAPATLLLTRDQRVLSCRVAPGDTLVPTWQLALAKGSDGDADTTARRRAWLGA
ncbi:MAG: M61 family metallopeptidase [Burkholderiaceae bacterium]|nr:M61 family metallopeptidase [Burkholderiaceae bacterium]